MALVSAVPAGHCPDVSCPTGTTDTGRAELVGNYSSFAAPDLAVRYSSQKETASPLRVAAPIRKFMGE